MLKRHTDISHSPGDASADPSRSVNSHPTPPPTSQPGGIQASSSAGVVAPPTGEQSPHILPEPIMAADWVDGSLPTCVPDPSQPPLMPTGFADFRAPYDFSDTELSHLQGMTSYMEGAESSTACVNFSPFELGDLSMLTEQTPEGGRELSGHADVDGHGVRTRSGSPFWSWLPTAPPVGCSLAAVGEQHSPRSIGLPVPLHHISEERRLHVENLLGKYRDVIPELPSLSCHTWTRYLTSFWEGFQPHMPFIHVPTTSFEDLSIEEILAFAAMGAQYRFEHHNADRLFSAGKAVVMEDMKRVEGSSTYRNTRPPATRRPATRSSQRSARLLASASEGTEHETDKEDPDRRRTLFRALTSAVVLLGYAAWETAELVKESLEMQTIISEILRLIGMKEDSTASTPASWADWARSESHRRIQLVAFCWLHTLSIAYNHPPVMMCSEIGLRLPCAPAEWIAKSEAEWRSAQACSKAQPSYQESLSLLMTSWPNSIHPRQESTPLGNYILLHGLIHRIYLIHELAKLDEHDTSGRTRMRFEELE